MISYRSSLTAEEIKLGDSILWESFDASGWNALDKFYKLPVPSICEKLDHESWKKRKNELLHLANKRFTKAIGFAGSSPLRHGRSLIGLVWTEYHQLLQSGTSDPTASHSSRFSPLLAKCVIAKEKLESVDLDSNDKLYLALANHLLGVLHLESCQGNEAEEHLQVAERHYSSVGQFEKRFEVLHLLGKLKQCQQEFRTSISLFATAEKSSDIERRARAFLARVTTLFWLGYTREAWQNLVFWERLQNQLSPVMHANLIIRGWMLFGSIATRIGDFLEARAIFVRIDTLLHCQSNHTDFCMAVYGLIRAEFCLETGDIVAMEKWLAGIQWSSPVPRGGYDCFEILYLGSSCRQCVSECWTCETWCCDACGCCTPQLIIFRGETKLLPVDVSRIMNLMIKGLRGRGYLANGDLAKAELELADVVRELPTIFPTGSAATLPYKAELLKILQARDNDGQRILACGNEILSQIAIHKEKRFAIASDVERALGLWRSELSEDDVAVPILKSALVKALNARIPNHPEVLALRCEIIQIQSQLPSSDLVELEERLSSAIANLSNVVDCLDHRRLAALRTQAWIGLLGHHFAYASRCFTRLEKMWLQLQERNHASIYVGDSRVILGRVASEIECGTPMNEVTEQLHRAIQHIVANSTLQSLAHDLNRIGLVLLWRKCFQSSYFFVKKSLDQYESMGDAVNCETVRQSLLTILQEAKMEGIEIEEL